MKDMKDIVIGNILIEPKGSFQLISALVGPYPIWYRVSSEYSIAPNDATCFLSSALVPAMLIGRDITVDPEYFISQNLMDNLDRIQEIFTCWNPIFKKISVQARTKTLNSSGVNCSAFFSGGVDGSYTLLKHKDILENLILINGFDFNMDSNTWRNMVERNQKIAKMMGKNLITIETNLKEFTAHFGLSRFANYGATLASVAQLLNVRDIYLSAALTYEYIIPDGSHPLLDPLWSTETCKLHHTGLESDRMKKVELVKNVPEVLSNLWVCWEDPRVNCGTCSKCIRTYIALKLSNIDDFPFQQAIRPKDICSVTIRNDEELSFFELFLTAANNRNKKLISKQLTKIILKYKFKAVVRYLDDKLLSSTLTHWKRQRIGIKDDLVDISLTARYTDKLMLRTIIEKLDGQKKYNSTICIGSVFFT